MSGLTTGPRAGSRSMENTPTRTETRGSVCDTHMLKARGTAGGKAV
jgi:hypothetical protein